MTIDVQHLKNLAQQIARKKDELQGLIETSDTLQQLAEAVKAAQEAYNAAKLADVEVFALTEEIKGLSKELKEGAKTASKVLKNNGFDITSTHVASYVSKVVKGEENVEKVITTGSKFFVLKDTLK